MKNHMPAVFSPLVDFLQIGRAGKSSFKTEALFLFQMPFQFFQKQFPCLDLDRLRSKRRKALGDHVRVDKCPAICFMHQVIQGKCSFSCPIRTCDDMALWRLFHLINGSGWNNGLNIIFELDACLRIHSVRFCGGVRSSLPSLMWMPMPLSSIMWMSGR